MTAGVVGGQGDEAELFARHHRRLVCDTARALRCRDDLAEDAAGCAWVILLVAQPRRETVYAWLRVVVNHTFDLGSEGEGLSGGLGGCLGFDLP